MTQPRRGSGNSCAILLYHRIGRRGCDPWRLCVSPGHFAEQMEVVREIGHPLRLEDLAVALGTGNLPRHGIVCTFDDGYADNLYNAKPLLERFEVPATVFVATGQLGASGEFWWDALERLLLHPGELPDELSLKIGRHLHHWKLGSATTFSHADSRRNATLCPWKASQGSRHHLYYEIWKRLLPLVSSEQSLVLDRLHDWAGQESSARPSHRSLSKEELVRLGTGPFIGLGAHTRTHPALPCHSEEAQRREIRISKTFLEETTDLEVTGFSYPYGRRSEKTVELVREAGFAYACTTQADSVSHSADRLQIPRVVVEDWGREEFRRRITRLFS